MCSSRVLANLSTVAQDDWSKAEQLLHWFKAGAEEDSFASLRFSKTLGQGARAAIHRCVLKRKSSEQRKGTLDIRFKAALLL